jgi:hypothetical protein
MIKINRKEIEAKPVLGDLEKIIEYVDEKDDEKCNVYISLKGWNEWKKLGYNNISSSDIMVMLPNSVTLFFRKFSKDEINSFSENYIKENYPENPNTSPNEKFWQECIVKESPFKVYQHQENILQLNLGSQPFITLNSITKYIPKEKEFFHLIVPLITNDILLKKIFD